MKYCVIIALFILSFNLSGLSQTNENTSIDSSLAKRISISGFCLCKTSLTDLKKLDVDIKEINFEEMDLPKKCYIQDSRFINGVGYFTEQFPGLIFQKEKESDYIGKIRLTKEFKGKLPNGTYLELKDLKLKDVFLIYPEFKDKWGSRDCSDYWHFSNDTISFFVKINYLIQPQFPINEAYYLDKPVEAIDLLVSCYGIFNKPEKVFEEPTNEPLYFLDSIKVNIGVLELYDPTEIAFVSVYKDTSAIKMAGLEGKNGVIYIVTKSYAKDKYWDFFKSKSTDYLMAVPSLKNEKNVVYILNGKVLAKDFEGELYAIDNLNFVELTVISKKGLKEDYNIKDKQWGIIIKTTDKNKAN